MRNIPVMIFLALVLFILICGCTDRSAQSPATTAAIPTPGSTGQVPPATPVAGLSSQTNLLPPGPVQTVPAYESVSVTVDRNTITEDPTITVTFNGGKGLGMTEQMNVYVIRADGTQLHGYVNHPQIGSSVTLMGDTQTDRVIVTVTMTSGDQYKIIDKEYPFPAQL